MRAIILAAGMGTRLRPLTQDTPKALIKILGEPLIERQIKFLKEKNINDIIIVTGYLREKFDYLKGKYGVKLVHNFKYDLYNNIYSMYLVREFLKDTYVIEADVYMNNNIFEENPQISKYYSAKKSDFKDEWMIISNQNGKVTDIEIGSKNETYILSGISYWTKESGDFIVNKLENIITCGEFYNYYWDDVVREHLKELDIYIRKIETNDIFEIDSIDDYNSITNIIKSLKSDRR